MLGSTNIPGRSSEYLSISLNGSNVIRYNGIDPKNLNITASSIGAAASNHNHDNLYSKLNHTHIKSQITDFPTTLPANGGNSDTVDGLHASAFARTNHNHIFTSLKANTDLRNVSTIPNDYNAVFEVTGLKTKAAAGNPIGNVGNYVTTVGIRGWGDPSGGNAVEIAFGSQNQIWIRSGNSTVWDNGWVTISCINSQATSVQSGSPPAGNLWAW